MLDSAPEHAFTDGMNEDDWKERGGWAYSDIGFLMQI